MSEQPQDVSRENFRIEGSLQLEGTLLPSESDLYDLGSSERRFRDLWLAFPTEEHEPVIHIGDETFTGTDVINARNVTRLATDALQPYDFIFKTGGVNWWDNIVPLGTPTTVHGYSITDAYVMSEIEDFYAGNVAIDGYNKFDWDSTRLSVFETSANWNEVYNNMQGGNSEIKNLTIEQQLIVNPTNTDHTITISGGYIHGPNTLYIDPFDNTDPSTKQDITGTVVVLGNLQVEGTTTTINSSEVAIVDKTIELAKDSTTPSQANGAGLTVAGANANITYNQPVDRWEFNKGLKVSGTSNIDGRLYVKSISDDIAGGTLVLKHDNNNTTDVVSTIFFENNAGTTSYIQAETVDGSLNGQISFFTRDGTTTKRAVTIDSQQRVGIGTNNPGAKLEVNSGTNDACLQLVSTDSLVDIRMLDDTTTDLGIRITTKGNDLSLQRGGGNVGIGTTSPEAKLHVPQPSGTIGGSDLSKAAILLGSTTKGIGIDDNEIVKKGSSLVIGTVSSDPIIFKTNNNNNSAGMRLTDVGLGIGIESPTSTLHVYGSARIERNGESPLLQFTDRGNSNRWIGIVDGTDRFSVYANDGLTEQLTIDTNGNVGIGTTSPGTDKLKIVATHSGAGKVIHAGSTEAETNGFILQGNGNVGIGTPSPVSKLHVLGGNHYDEGITLGGRKNDGTSLTTLRFFHDDNNTAHISRGSSECISIKSDGKVGIGTTSPTQTLTVDGNLLVNKRDVDTGNKSLFFSSGGAADHPTLDIYDKDANDGARICANGDSWISAKGGNVGIGTTSPVRPLHVNSGADNMAARFTSTDTAVQIELEDLTGRGWIEARNDFRFGNNEKELMRIDTIGNVGIGSNNPEYRLHVQHPTTNSVALFESLDGRVNIRFRDSNTNNDSYIGAEGNDLMLGNVSGGNHVTVKPTGKVGIGTTDPTETLEVNGNLKVTGQIQASDTSGESYSSTTLIIDTNYTAADFRALEIVGTSDPNMAGSGNYRDPIHMHVYRGTGWNGSANTEYVYCVHLAPMARTQFPSGGSNNGNDVDVCWVDTNGVESDNCPFNSTSHKLRLKLVEQRTHGAGYSPNWSIKTTRKF